MKNQKRLAGYLLIAAAVTFWISWLLMPDPGTTDTQHILEIVKQSRDAVLGSIIVQIMSSVLFLLSLLLMVRTGFTYKKTMIGISLLAIGAMGLCADAFFHLLAWFMTDNSITIQQDIVRVMDFMQTKGLYFLVPILLPFFAGSILLATGLHGQRIISGMAKFIFIAALVIGILITAAIKIQIYNRSVPMLGLLGLFAAGQVVAGLELINMKFKNNSTVSGSDLRIVSHENELFKKN